MNTCSHLTAIFHSLLVPWFFCKSTASKTVWSILLLAWHNKKLSYHTGTVWHAMLVNSIHAMFHDLWELQRFQTI